MKKLLLLGAVLLMVLFAGCVGGEQPPAETGDTEMGDEEDGTAEDTGDETEDTGEETGDGTEETEETEDEVPEDTGEVDLEGLAYMELIALGVPVQCEITTTYEGETTTATMYMQGEKVRYESTYDSQQMIVIMLDDTTYMSNFMASEVPECEWLMMVPEDTEPEPGEPGDYTYTTAVPDFEDMPETSFECSPWIYDASKFQAPTENVCTMDEFTDLMMEGFDIPQ